VRYRWEDVLKLPEGIWLARFKEDSDHRERQRQHLTEHIRRASEEALQADPPPVSGDHDAWLQRHAAYVKTYLYDHYTPLDEIGTVTITQENN